YTPAQAQVGLHKLSALDTRLAHRRERAAAYARLLGDAVELQSVPAAGASTYYFLAARIPGGAGAMKRRLLRAGIDSAAGEEVADDCARLLGYDDCPEAARAYEEVLALPFYDGIEERIMARVASVIRKGRKA
ncbi:MAG: DegT/DnrJ/EryC1/StrS family aminotransferase, partial [Candidatus Hydrogenedentes bacterium]|nr:DegT/DnrJ/EryC1/StrS family aminotransferase [Candidatus Hydrogenedentota bacterium]